MREPQVREIDGYKFEVMPLGFKAARSAFVRLTKALGPALARAANAAPDLESLRTSAAQMDLVSAVSELADRVSDDELEWFADTFGKTTRFSRTGEQWPYLTADNREALFSGGSLLLFFRWLAFALEVNFADFFEWLRRAGDGGDHGAGSEAGEIASTRSTSPEI